MAPVVKEENSHMIMIEIQYEEHTTGQQILSFETERNAPLRRIFLDFCDRLDLVYSSLRFTLDGYRIGEMQTAHECGLTDGDIIDVFSDQMGGGGAAAAAGANFSF